MKEIGSIYIAADAHARIDITNVLRKDWPSLRFVSRASEADAILEVRIGMYRPYISQTFPEATRSRVVRQVTTTGVRSYTVVTKPSDPNLERGRQAALLGGAAGVLRMRGQDEELVIYSALPSPFFATRLAQELVALRDHLVD